MAALKNIRSARVPALAKINLSLKVLHKRPDNFHELRTVFQTISLADELELTFQPARETSVLIESSIDIPDNLAVRAAQMVLDASKATGSLLIRLTKRIPMGGGLGGGSTDAAAVLMALPKLTGRSILMPQLVEIATKLGSDVPFFLLGGTALGLGRGEELYPFPQPKRCYGVLVTPQLHVSTPEAYAALNRTASPAKDLSTYFTSGWAIADNSPIEEWQEFCENDFEEPAFRAHPELDKLKRKLKKAGAAVAMMTGSGSALFGLFSEKDAALRAATMFSKVPCVPFELVNRKQYRKLWEP